MTTLIPLYRGRGRSARVVGHAKVDDADAELVGAHRWGIRTAPGELRYATTYIDKRETYMHRLILGDEAQSHTDHKDGDGLNNQRANLRPCSHAENMQNRSHQSNRGVRQLPSGRWRARVRDKHLGVFDTQDEALEAARAERAALMPFATN